MGAVGGLFEGYVPGGNWVTVGYRFPPGPSSEVHLGRLEWKGQIMEKTNKTMEKPWKNRAKPSENLVNHGKLE
jgi:hypothetical protein